MIPIEKTHEEVLGEAELRKGAVAVLAVAGGQGTRLKFNGPKGIYPVGLKGESLFQLLAEKVVKASEKYGKALPLAIMTSPQNRRETEEFFKKHDHFGLEPFFFNQGELPFLDDEGKPLEVLAPDGNGYALHNFAKSGGLELFKKRGVTTLSFILIDNALTNPFEVKGIGYHKASGADVTVKAILKKEASEKLGTVVVKEGKVQIVEYSEQLLSGVGNMGEFLFSIPFVERIKKASLPIHLAKKEMSRGVFANKQEAFIFDLLPLSAKTNVLIYPRNRNFSPLKNASGENSEESVKRDLLYLKSNNLLD